MIDRFKELLPFATPLASAADTRSAALRATNRFAKIRYRQILALLADRPLCIFETAALISSLEQTTIHDHQISGRFGAMVEGGLITKSDARRTTPTGCSAAVYQITLAGQAVLKEPSNLIQHRVQSKRDVSIVAVIPSQSSSVSSRDAAAGSSQSGGVLSDG